MVGAYTIAQWTSIAAPLTVATLCVYAYRRRIGGQFLLLWAVAHVALSATFAIIATAPPVADLAGLPWKWSLGMATVLFCNGLLLIGVLEIEQPRFGLTGGLLASAAAALVLTVGAIASPWILLHVTMPLAALAVSGAGIVLLVRRRSAVYVVAGLVLLLRSVNGILFALAAYRTEALSVPSYVAPLTIFFNFLTGLALLTIAFDNAWRRLGELLDATSRAKAVADAVLDVAPVSIIQKDRDLRVISANRRAQELASLLVQRHDDIIGLRSDELTPGPHAEQAEELDRRLLADPTCGPLEYEGHYPKADGTTLTMLVRKAALVDDSNHAFGTITASLDVTDLKRTESKLRESVERAERASQEKTNFLANMSHELRTPLNGIAGFAEMLAAGYLGPLEGRQLEYVDNIRASSRTMLDLVSDILDLSRIDAGRLTLKREPVDIAALLAEIADAVTPSAEAEGIVLRVSTAPGTVAEADRRALLQALANVVDNAVRYNRPGGEVWIAARSADGRTTITIRDTGPGMTAEQIEATGDPFLRGDAMKARPGGGSGLGLAIARGLVDLHGGRFAIESRIGEGTSVRIEL